MPEKAPAWGMAGGGAHAKLPSIRLLVRGQPCVGSDEVREEEQDPAVAAAAAAADFVAAPAPAAAPAAVGDDDEDDG
jgi:hypothetical protein